MKNKKLIVIIAAVAAVLIIAAAVIALSSNKAEAPGKDMDVSGGAVENIFDEESEENRDDVADSDKDTGNNAQSIQGSNVKPSGQTDYEAFHNMSPSQQQAYIDSFKSIDHFFKWYNKAKKEYERTHPEIEVDGGPVELE